jgi:hypothetical protein
MEITITRAQFEAARERMKNEYGVLLEGDGGILSHSGVHISFAYKEPTLDITVLSKPFFIKESTIETDIAEWFTTT